MVPVSEMSSVLTFPKLNRNNYYVWADNMMSALQARLLWLIIDGQRPSPPKPSANPPIVTNFIWPYLHQFSIDSYGLNGYGKPLKRPFDQYQSRLEAINNGRDIRQIN